MSRGREVRLQNDLIPGFVNWKKVKKHLSLSRSRDPGERHSSAPAVQLAVEGGNFGGEDDTEIYSISVCLGPVSLQRGRKSAVL